MKPRLLPKEKYSPSLGSISIIWDFFTKKKSTKTKQENAKLVLLQNTIKWKKNT